MAAVIIQARMGSSRLPGKTLEPLGEATVLDWVVDRTLAARRVTDVIVATTTEPNDDVIERHLDTRGLRCVRGSSADVLSRYALAAQSTSADTLVRITADCPLVDPAILDSAIELIEAEGSLCDYVSTSIDGRFPRGLDVEAFTRSALLEAAEQAVDPDEREHVTLHIYRSTDRFFCAPVVCPEPLRRPDLRFTVDEEADLEVVRQIVDGLGPSQRMAPGARIVEFLDRHPEIARINSDVKHRNVK